MFVESWVENREILGFTAWDTIRGGLGEGWLRGMGCRDCELTRLC